MNNAARGMTMLCLIVVVIMMGFPTAFTLMGLGMLFGYVAFYDLAAPWLDNRIFDLMVQRAFGAMTNETLLSIPLFVLMGYVMERGALVDKMFHSVQLAFRKLPGSLAVTTLVICTFWGIASGLVGAVVVLTGVIAMRPMLNAGYDTRLAAGVITAGGTLGILIPPSVMIIVCAAVAGQSVVKLYAAAMFPGVFLAFLYLVYVIGWCMINPKIAPCLPMDQMRAPITPWVAHISSSYSRFMLPALITAVVSPARALRSNIEGVRINYWTLLASLARALGPTILAIAMLGAAWWYVTIYSQEDNENGSVAAVQMAKESAAPRANEQAAAGGSPAPPGSDDLLELSGSTARADTGAEQKDEPLREMGVGEGSNAPKTEPVPEGFYNGFLITCLITVAVLANYYRKFDANAWSKPGCCRWTCRRCSFCCCRKPSFSCWAGRWNGPRSSWSSCRSFCHCWRISRSTQCCRAC